MVSFFEGDFDKYRGWKLCWTAIINRSTTRTLAEDFMQAESINNRPLMTFIKRHARGIFGTEIILLIALSVFLPAAWAETTQGQTTPAKIVAVLHCDYAPVAFWDRKTDKPSGFFVDIMDAIAPSSGLQVQYVCKNGWSEMISAVESSEADLSVLLKSKEREKNLLFSTPIDMTYLSFFTRSQSSADANKVPAAGYTVGAVKGSMSYEQLKNRPGLRLQAENSYEEGIFKLLAGEADLFAGEDTSILKAARGAGLSDRIKKVGKPFVERERGIAVQKNNIRLLELLNKSLAGFIGSPEYQSIYVKWYGAPAPYWTIYRILSAGGILLFIVVCGMVFWRYQSITRINAALKLQIAERKQAEENAREKGRFIESIVNLSPDILYIYDLVTRRNVYSNNGINTILGYSVEEVATMADRLLPELMHPDDFKGYIEKTVPLYALVKDGERISHQYRMRDKSGTWRWLDCTEIIYQRLPDGSSQQILGVVHDISDRKEAEKKILENEEHIRNILNTVDDGFIVVDHDYRIMTANQAFCNQASQASNKVVGMHCYQISHLTERPCFEDGEDCPVQKVFATGVSHTAVHKHLCRNGEILFVETKAFPNRDESGKVISVIETTRNITERHLLEQEQLKTQKLEAIGTLAGGIAHDFNNLLQGVFGYVSLAKITAKNPEKCTAALEEAEKALHQSVNLTTQLLTFAKGGKPDKKLIDLRAVIENSAKFMLSGSRSDLRLDLPEDLWQANVDGGQLGQVIQNIVLNADQAMPLGGTIKIAAANRGKGDASLPHGIAQDNYVMIAIQDTGVGIPEPYLSKIFDPYFTTKERGSGLGLATSYSIIRNHGGIIDVRTQSGAGTTFTTYLPAVAGAVRTEAAGKPPELAQSRRAKILVMDDEEIIRNISSALLVELGHDAEAAKHGQEAVEKYRSAIAAGNPFDFVILDLTIRGGTGGVETIRQLLKMDPHVKAIVSSGYSDDSGIGDYLSLGFKASLKKPYTVDALRDITNKILDSSNH